MTRREEIEQAILENGIDYCENHPEMNMSLKVAFVLGAEWADKTMIEKACQWIESYLFDIGFPDDWCSGSATMKRGKQRFLEAMEE